MQTEGSIEGRPVRLQAWRYDVSAEGGFVVPIYLLDTELPENADWDRTLTHHLYGGSNRRAVRERQNPCDDVRSVLNTYHRVPFITQYVQDATVSSS